MSAIKCCFFKATLSMFSSIKRRQSQCVVRAETERATDAIAQLIIFTWEHFQLP